MKQLRNLIGIILIVIALLCYGQYRLQLASSNHYDQQLYVYNWGEYIDPQVIDDFEKEYQIDVIYETYDSNETLYTKLKNHTSRYDVVFPSEYMVDKMNQEQLLLPIDYEKISNIKDIDSRLINVSGTNPDTHVSVPYFWGTVGIIYDQTKTDLTFDSWEDLWDPSLENQVILVDSVREAMGFSLQSLGYSVNSLDPKQLKLAQNKLMTLRPNIKAIIGDEILQIMPADEATAAITWSGSARNMIKQNPNLAYAIPQEGTNIWVDSAVIPNTCGNIEGAHQFINYLMDANVSKLNSEYVGYSTTNLKTQEMFKENGTYDPLFYPDESITKNFEFYRNLSPQDTMLYNDLFLEFKMF